MQPAAGHSEPVQAESHQQHQLLCLVLTRGALSASILVLARREDDAAAALTSGGAFKRKVQAMCGRQLPAPVPMQAPVQACQYRQGAQSVGAVSARPIGDFLNKIGEGIFVGTFRGNSHDTLLPSWGHVPAMSCVSLAMHLPGVKRLPEASRGPPLD